MQTIIDREFDYAEAIDQIIQRTLDNGLICARSQSIIFPREDDGQGLVAEQLAAKGALYVTDPETVEKFRAALFPDGAHINSKLVGQYTSTIAEEAGVEIPEGTTAIVLRADEKRIGSDDPICGEKMCPVITAIPYDTFDDALAIAKTNLEYQGAGHSAVIHTNDRAKAERAGHHASRVPACLVNQPGIFAANPALANGLNPTSTLGCGSWGNNSISENLTFEHLINISRIAWPKAPENIPAPESIWE